MGGGASHLPADRPGDRKQHEPLCPPRARRPLMTPAAARALRRAAANLRLLLWRSLCGAVSGRCEAGNGRSFLLPTVWSRTEPAAGFWVFGTLASGSEHVYAPVPGPEHRGSAEGFPNLLLTWINTGLVSDQNRPTWSGSSSLSAAGSRKVQFSINDSCRTRPEPGSDRSNRNVLKTQKEGNQRGVSMSEPEPEPSSVRKLHV